MYLKRIKELREDFDKKQKEVAIYLKITREQYSLYETGKRDFPFELIIELAKYYNVSIDYIGELTDEKIPYKRSKNYELWNNIKI